MVKERWAASEEIQLTYTRPNAEAQAAFAALPSDQPIDMMNFIRFREKADYPPNSGFEDKGWTGAQAYAEYSRTIRQVADQAGARIIYSGDPRLTMIGPEGETWDRIFVVRYNSAAAFNAFISSSIYRANGFHRTAAVADSRLYRLAPPDQDQS